MPVLQRYFQYNCGTSKESEILMASLFHYIQNHEEFANTDDE
jgi:hypothetical protein